MTLMNSELHAALIASGTPEDKARKAAAFLHGLESRLDQIDRKIEMLKITIGDARSAKRYPRSDIFDSLDVSMASLHRTMTQII